MIQVYFLTSNDEFFTKNGPGPSSDSIRLNIFVLKNELDDLFVFIKFSQRL